MPASRVGARFKVNRVCQIPRTAAPDPAHENTEQTAPADITVFVNNLQQAPRPLLWPLLSPPNCGDPGVCFSQIWGGAWNPTPPERPSPAESIYDTAKLRLLCRTPEDTAILLRSHLSFRATSQSVMAQARALTPIGRSWGTRAKRQDEDHGPGSPEHPHSSAPALLFPSPLS